MQKSNERNEADNLDSLAAVIANNHQRVDNDRQRYRQYFGIDAYDLDNYDEVVDTTNLDLEQVVAKVADLIRQRLSKD